MRSLGLIADVILATTTAGLLFAPPPSAWAAGGVGERAGFTIELSRRIPLRDGAHLNANVYRPLATAKAGCIFEVTPYGAARYHDFAAWLASHGYTFLLADSRGRGASDGVFRPNIQEARDGYDVVEWLARDPACRGKVAMGGLSYMGYNQWATAKEMPPHLVTIVPTAAGYPGLDFPGRGNIPSLYAARYLTLVSGTAMQERLFADRDYWTALFREHLASGKAYIDFAAHAGDRADTFREWAAHAHPDAYWNAYVPTAAQYAGLELPILTITGSYDVDQTGALGYYRNHMRHGSASAKGRHYLVIGPWDHLGTMSPQAQFGGLTFGPNSLVDMRQLHLDWYDWVLNDGPKPAFLKDRVVYYVMGADEWRHAPTLESITGRQESLYLNSAGSADDVFASGTLQPTSPEGAGIDGYVDDPRDPTGVDYDTDPDSLVTQTGVYNGTHRLLVYHTRPFERATEISGSFRLEAWISIDQPDASFRVAVYEITAAGDSILLSTDLKRARNRAGTRQEQPVATRDPLQYVFDGFTFVSRRVEKGSRLRLVIGPVNAPAVQRNYNSGKPASEETAADARPVTVRVHHGARWPTILRVPIGQGATGGRAAPG